MARAEEGFFDDLARGLADGTLTRGKALRLMGAAVVGSTLGSLGIGGEASADPIGCKRNGKNCTRNDQCCSRNCSGGSCRAQTTTTTTTSSTTSTTTTPTTTTSTSTTPGCAPDGVPCSSGTPCCSGNCSNGTCCPTGRVGLSNGTCALPCFSASDCPNCACVLVAGDVSICLGSLVGPCPPGGCPTGQVCTGQNCQIVC